MGGLADASRERSDKVQNEQLAIRCDQLRENCHKTHSLGRPIKDVQSMDAVQCQRSTQSDSSKRKPKVELGVKYC